MPKIDMSAYMEAEAGGEYSRMRAGGYVCRIIGYRTSGTDWTGREVDYPSEKQYVKLLWDVAEGEFAGKFSDSFYADKDYAHCLYLSWKNLGALKSNMEALEVSNPGWDPMGDFQRDNWQGFVGKLFGAVLGEEEYVGNDGEVKTRLGLPSVRSVWNIRDGKFKVPDAKKLDGAQQPQRAAGKAALYDDVPF